MTPLLAYIGPGAGFAFLGSFLGILLAGVLSLASVLAWPFRVLKGALTGRRPPRRAAARKVIFLGLDGLDPRLTERFMAEGKLPNLARLASQGSFHRLRTTFPSLSPVAWSTFATGVSPARHNIFDFLNRDLRTYVPELSSSRVRAPRRFWKIGRYRIPLEAGSAELRRRSQPFWKILGDYRVACTILRVPITFPPEKFNGRLLSAMCTPDLRGTQGSFSHFTIEKAAAHYTGGSAFPLRPVEGGWEGVLEGPENSFTAEGGPVKIPFRLSRPDGLGAAALHIQGRTLRLQPDSYSPWVRLDFRCAPGVNIRGLVRFLLTGTGAEPSLYVTPIQIDPAKPALPISHPSYYALYLAKLTGPFATAGMAEDTWALNEGVISEQAFLEQAYLTHGEREAMFFSALERTRRGVVVCVFDATDRIQHMFFRKLADGGREIEDLYRRADTLVGRTLEYVDDRTVLFVLSDHGFAAFRRGVNLNTWLHRNGYLALQDGASESGPYFERVDWSRTRAYALGLSGVYLNVKGREASGIVEPGDAAEALAAELAARLTGLEDAVRGEVAIRTAYPTGSLYRGPYLDAAPDLIIGYNNGYRISWDAATGKVAREIFEDNTLAWSGDHAVDPPLVPGVLFSNRPVGAPDPGLEDMAPTALALFGIDPPGWMEGKPVFQTA